MTNELFLNKIETFFGVHNSTDVIELETWTSAGVNMFVVIHKDDKKTYADQFKERVENFDVDEEIELHRQDDRYKSAFSIRRSLEDFEGHQGWLNGIVDDLKL